MFCCFCTNVSATDEDTNINEDIILMNLYTDTVSTTLSKSSSEANMNILKLTVQP